MFTGIIEEVGKVVRMDQDIAAQNLRLSIASSQLALEAKIGDSIAINGVCLTAIPSPQAGELSFEISPETFEKTTLKYCRMGSEVNLEGAVRASGRLGGHIVQGHIDALGKIGEIENLGAYHRIEIQMPSELRPYVVSKGSIAVDGVSLTVNNVSETSFQVMIIPHTWTATIFHSYKPGHSVNLETDILGRYVVELMQRRDLGIFGKDHQL